MLPCAASLYVYIILVTESVLIAIQIFHTYSRGVINMGNKINDTMIALTGAAFRAEAFQAGVF